MKLLIVGSGGREHALAWKAAQSQSVDKVYVAPGNAGTAAEQKLENISIDVMDFDSLADFAEANQIALTIVGPEAPLVAGIVDFFQSRKLKCFGPTRNASQLEGSKAFAKNFLIRNNIPTAAFREFTDAEAAIGYVREKGTPIVIKADGLAAGKGVIVAEDLATAEQAIVDMLSGNAFGDAGCRVVIEDFLEGEEASFIVIADGKQVVAMATSQDHKRAGDGDTGLNTGGMGAYSPAPVVTPEIHERIMREIINPTIEAMAKEGNAYTGFLYAGLMISNDGSPKVIEYNCRFGDPETQPIMMRLSSDLTTLCLAAIEGTLEHYQPEWDPRPAVGVVLASGGYPSSYAKGHAISGLGQQTPESKIFHAGTTLDENGVTITNGGRVLCATAIGETITLAQKAAYQLAESIHWQDMFYRHDIAYRAIDREQQTHQTD